MPMKPNMQKELFSIAYIRAIAAVAGCKVTKPDPPDDDSVDLHIGGYFEAGMKIQPNLDVQMKCTGNDLYLNDANIPFDLKQKNYNDLCPTHFQVPRILVVVIVPTDFQQWLDHSEEELRLRYCGYWHNLRGEPSTPQRQKRVYLSRTNVLNAETLGNLMKQIGETGSLS